MNKLFLLLFFFGCIANAQHQDKVDFIKGDVFIDIEPKQKKVNGTVVYQFKVLKDVDSVFLDAKNMMIESIFLDVDLIPFKYDEERITIFKKFKQGQIHLLELNYLCTPKQTLYFLGWEDQILGNEQIWTQGQGKYTSHWLPSFDDMEEKIEFDLNFGLPQKNLSVVANGMATPAKLIDHLDMPMFPFDMQKPMSSYLLAFAIGNYEKQELKSTSGIPIENYYYPQDSLKVEPTYRYTKEIFDFIEEEIGFPYPWQNYKQIPVRDFLYAGMENTTATIFSDGYVIDSTAFVDKNYVNVNAHELAHQWFGNLVTEKDGHHHWLHEGFATYYAQLAEKKVFGDDHYYWKLYKSLIQLKDLVARGEGQALTDPKASSLVFYEKGAWALYMLHNQIGDTAFRKGIQNYLDKYKFKNVTIPDFLKEMEIASGVELSAFNKNWLENEKLPFEVAKKQLRQDSKSLDQMFAMEEEIQKAQSDDIDYISYWDSTNSIHLKKHILGYRTSLPEEIYERAFASDTVPIRQSLLSPRDLPSFMDKEKLESFLEDSSYITIEGALLALWQAYPEDRGKYLDATKNVVGLPNKNVRLLWLTLAMLSESYNGPKTKVYFDELSSYTNSQYGFEIRQNAFFYLKEAFGLNDASLTSLVKATEHHAWQFKKFARDLLKELLKDSDYKTRLEKLSLELNSEESGYLKTQLKKE
ncbi:M1 family metallopeptidase [Maribacter sp. 2308TA10-17]|uniref:M1 family metallopeptidase n=1 Tax=Maribacter sp. 2308TA10-17 TaxID=3386276 RepID=UPI0039BD125B